MGIRLVYGLKTSDASYLDVFYPSRRLAQAAAALGIDYGALVFPPGSSEREALEACRGHTALLRGELPAGLYRRLESAGARVINPSRATELARDKLACAAFFSARGAAHPPTVGFSSTLAEPARPPLPYPFVAKPRYGKMGRGVALIEGQADWAAYLRAARPERPPRRRAVSASAVAAGPADPFGSPDEPDYLAQGYLAASRGRDIRFFFASWPDGAPWVAVERRGPDFLSNAHAGAAMHAYSPSPELAATAEGLFAAAGLAYGTVDFLYADAAGRAFAACELNACPGFEELERATGLDAAAAVLRAALRFHDRNGKDTDYELR